MSSGRAPSTVTDDQVRAILVAPVSETNKALGNRLNIPQWSVDQYRSRRVPRALRIAKELGLLRDPEPVPVAFTPAEREIIRSHLEP